MKVYDFTTMSKFNKQFLEFQKELVQGKTFNAIVFANWCGHCQTLKKSKAAIIKEVKKSNSPTSLVFIEHEVLTHMLNNHSNHAFAQISSSAVQGFPTVYKAKFNPSNKTNVNVDLFEGNRNVISELVSFFNSN